MYMYTDYMYISMTVHVIVFDKLIWHGAPLAQSFLFTVLSLGQMPQLIGSRMAHTLTIVEPILPLLQNISNLWYMFNTLPPLSLSLFPSIVQYRKS